VEEGPCLLLTSISRSLIGIEANEGCPLSWCRNRGERRWRRGRPSSWSHRGKRRWRADPSFAVDLEGNGDGGEAPFTKSRGIEVEEG
jgi:hypothetical protein